MSNSLRTVLLILSFAAVFGVGLWMGGARPKHETPVALPAATAAKKPAPARGKWTEEQAAQAKRTVNLASIANLLEVDETIANELLNEYEGVRDQYRLITRDGQPENDPPDITTFYIHHLGLGAEENPLLKQWLAGRPGSFIGESIWGASAVPPRLKGPLPDFLLAGKYGNSGTGFFVSPDGWLVTNAHVVGQRQKVDIRGPSGVIVTVRVVKVDTKADIALLKSDSPSRGHLQIQGRELPLGTRVFTIGFPNVDTQGSQAKFTEGSISSLAGWRDNPHDYQISVPLQQGNSGGALVDTSTGMVAGVVTSSIAPSRADNVGYAIKASALADLVRATPECKGIAWLDSAAPESDRAQNIERAIKASVMVLVN